jgi:predicted  nucleic acid-binding Zn-ribbon protein
MNADLEHLIVLQAQDLELKRLREELAEAPRRVAAAQTARAKAEVALAETNAAILKEETLRRSQELEVKERHTKIARLQKQMETATSAAQITAFEHEIAHSQTVIASLEDEELASMERTEALEAKRAATTGLLATTTATLAAERERSARVTEQNNAAILGIEAERKTLRTLIASTDAGESILSNYDRIAKAKGTGVSAAVDQKCSACQMLIRTQRWNDLSNRDPKGEFANTIFNCETCGRMLYFDPRNDAPVRRSPGERLAAASKG